MFAAEEVLSECLLHEGLVNTFLVQIANFPRDCLHYLSPSFCSSSLSPSPYPCILGFPTSFRLSHLPLLPLIYERTFQISFYHLNKFFLLFPQPILLHLHLSLSSRHPLDIFFYIRFLCFFFLTPSSTLSLLILYYFFMTAGERL